MAQVNLVIEVAFDLFAFSQLQDVDLSDKRLKYFHVTLSMAKTVKRIETISVRISFVFSIVLKRIAYNKNDRHNCTLTILRIHY